MSFNRLKDMFLTIANHFLYGWQKNKVIISKQYIHANNIYVHHHSQNISHFYWLNIVTKNNLISKSSTPSN